MKKKHTQRTIQAQKTKEHLYEITIHLIEKKGFENITVSEICKAAQVSVGTFYNYFESKYTILDIIFKVADEYFSEVVANALSEDTSQEKIVSYFRFYAQYNIDRGLDFVKQLYTVKNNLFAIKGRTMQQVLKKVIEEGQNKGELVSDMTADDIVEFLFVSVRGAVYNWALHDGSYDLIQYIDTFVKRLVKSIVLHTCND
ncbi:TetR family transcriptional regulator [Natranaerovirga hydrolytica]|uniref:TetR family transcriptional regulator n=1 Tax=Natranaerovirga hydrolytica TaxID=680378 RepID=A0A4R1MMU5_9FIRM|nr:TetR/AcrR family transcriptional regulator [Natranaerovirga hydrolytica]TCK92614.1 TetR family transcriptional regulator [Natranaerovirga hydrolytica]